MPKPTYDVSQGHHCSHFSSLLQQFLVLPTCVMLLEYLFHQESEEIVFQKMHFKPPGDPDTSSLGKTFQVRDDHCTSLVHLESLRCKGFLFSRLWVLALSYKPVELAYVHTLLSSAPYLCHSWSLDPVTWQREVPCGFPEKGERISPSPQNRPQTDGKPNSIRH